MDRVVAARKLIAELVKGEQIELRRAEIVGRDIAQLCETLNRPPTARELEDFLGDHTQVTELYASETLLEELIYRHLTPPIESTKLADVRHPELEAQIREAPDSIEPYSIYADWLQEHGDPMGELIALGIKCASGNDEDVVRMQRFLDLHRARFLDGLTKKELAPFALEWRHGVVCGIEEMVSMDRATPELWSRLLGLRVCGFVQTVALVYSNTPQVIAAVCELPLLRSLVVDDIPELSTTKLRSLSSRALRMTFDRTRLPPTLERLDLLAGEIQGAPGRLEIRELTVRVTESMATFVATAKLPRLEKLTLDLNQEHATQAIELLRGLELPVLTHLELRNGVLDVDTFEKLAKLPIAAQLTSLALNIVELTDDDVQSMLETRSFTSLAELDLSYNELTREALEAARKLAPNVISRRQAKPGNALERRIRRFAGSRLKAAEDIADPKSWKEARVDGDLRWARYSGTEEYELFISEDLTRYGCTCPSSIQPCKHVVALALVAARTELPEASSNNIEDRVERRRETYQPVWE